jgi:hypothetical protein
MNAHSNAILEPRPPSRPDHCLRDLAAAVVRRFLTSIGHLLVLMKPHYLCTFSDMESWSQNGTGIE